jgi:hypothetical protein
MRRHSALMALAALLAALAGCGGTAPSGSQNRAATFNIVWPTGRSAAQTRLFPDSTQSLRITIYSDPARTSEVADTVVAKGQTLVSIPNLPQGTLYYMITALPYPDGTGTPLARANGQFTVPQANPIVVNLSATVDHLVVHAASGSSNPALASGDQLSVVATPVDSAGNVVPVAASSLTWSWDSDQPAIAAVSVPGNADPSIALVTAGQGGTANITAKVKTAASDPNDPGASGSIAVQVGIVVKGSPTQVTITLGQSVAFSAAVLGTSNQAVTWSVQEANSGSIDPVTGQYTALNTPGGPFHILAVSAADPKKTSFVVATVTVVEAPKSTVVVNPVGVGLQTGAAMQFTATVHGKVDQTVTWSADGGTIDPNTGQYTAPATVPANPTTYHVTATANDGQTGQAIVVVTLTPPTTGDLIVIAQ